MSWSYKVQIPREHACTCTGPLTLVGGRDAPVVWRRETLSQAALILCQKEPHDDHHHYRL
jgi:hypothetical protein